MSKNNLLKEIEQWAYKNRICKKQDANYYFSYGYLSALKNMAREKNIDFTNSESMGIDKAEEYLRQEEIKNKYSIEFSN